MVSSLKRKSTESIDDLYPNELGNNRINSRWNSDELSMAVKGVRKYGKDFQAIAELLGTKTEQQVRTFYMNYRRKYNLDNVLKEFESTNSQQQQQQQNDEQYNNKDDQQTGDGNARNNVNNNSKSSDNDIMEVSTEKYN